MDEKTVENNIDTIPTETVSRNDSTVDVNIESNKNEIEALETNKEEPNISENKDEESKTLEDKDDSLKGKYTEEERLKRKAYFKQLREKRRLAREKYQHNYTKKFSRYHNDSTRNISISYTMTQEEKKMLDFYKVRLSTLKSENEQLHKRLAHLVNENMRFLQMGPPKTPA